MERSQSENVIVRELGVEDWELFRALRREALESAPWAYGSTLERWSGAGDTEQRWRNRLEAVELNLVAELDGKTIGMCSADGLSGTRPQVYGMWVTPTARGQGAVDAMIAYVRQWASDGQAGTLCLNVFCDNVAAVACYRRLGFSVTGPADDDGRELAMELDIS
jgi:ribosomal protein S18 acetylase RimI-like enzyme